MANGSKNMGTEASMLIYLVMFIAGLVMIAALLAAGPIIDRREKRKKDQERFQALIDKRIEEDRKYMEDVKSFGELISLGEYDTARERYPLFMKEIDEFSLKVSHRRESITYLNTDYD